MQEQGNARILVDLTVVQERPPGRVRAAYQLVGKISQNPPFFLSPSAGFDFYDFQTQDMLI